MHSVKRKHYAATNKRVYCEFTVHSGAGVVAPKLYKILLMGVTEPKESLNHKHIHNEASNVWTGAQTCNERATVARDFCDTVTAGETAKR